MAQAVLELTDIEKQAKKKIESLKPLQIDGEHFPCPRCGHDRMKEKVVKNALSRHADVYICSECGTEEAVMDMVGEVLPFTEWGMVRGD